MELGHNNFTRHSGGKASPEPPVHYGCRKLFRDAKRALREIELDHFERNPNSVTGLRIAAVRVEVERLSCGLPLRADAIARAVAGLSTVVPVRRPAVEPELAEVMTR